MRYWRKPLDSDRVRAARGEVRIIVERCKGCGFCIEYCPRDVLAESASFNRKGYHPPEVVKRGECVNCSLCEMICPDFAIFSVALTDGGVEPAPATQVATAAFAAAGGWEETGPPSDGDVS